MRPTKPADLGSHSSKQMLSSSAQTISSRKEWPSTSPMSQARSKTARTKAIQEARTKEKEWEFTVKHIGVLTVLIWVSFIHAVGIFFFTKGFLLTRMVLEDRSSCDVLPFHNSSSRSVPVRTSGEKSEGCWHRKSFDKAVIIIIDALRYDFTVPFISEVEDQATYHFYNNMPILYETAVESPGNAFLLPFIADPPTTTLQRLKGLTTGTLPTFIDAGSNFAGTAIDEDNLVAQLRATGKTLVQLGDDTWHSLFPGQFDANLTQPYDSFNVWDLHTVDNGVTEHLLPLLNPENTAKWDVIFGHFLGVDHAGHRYGPNNAVMAAKLRQMDQIIRDIIAKVDENTLLVVMGDHGMDPKGDHGGESNDEVESALWMYSKGGGFGRASSDTKLPPKSAQERRIPQIDFVPTFSLLLGLPIPFNNLGSPIEEAFIGQSGNNWENLVAVNRLTSAQIKRYQHEYAIARGEAKGQPLKLASLWDAAEMAWNKASKARRTSVLELRSVYDAYRKHQRHNLQVCRGLWAEFDMPSMIQGIAVLVGGISLLVIYARGTNINRAELTGALLSRVVIGLVAGGLMGALLSFFHLVDMSVLELSTLLATAASMLGSASALIGNIRTPSFPLPDSAWGWLAVLFTVSQSIGFASNSYTIWEDEILLFFLTTFGVAAGISSMRQISTSDRVLGVYHSIAFIVLGRLASISRLCREEQMPFCRSTYYTSSASSVAAPWQLIIPFLVTLALPSVVKSFYTASKSYEGAAMLWIGFAFRTGLLVSSVFWSLESADDGEWFSLSSDTLQSIRVFLAQVVLGLAFVAGTVAFVFSKPCVSISVEKKNAAPEKDKLPTSAQQSGKTTVTILGFGNVYGTRFLFMVINFCLGITIMQKPMGQGAVALLLWQILTLLEILDTNSLTMTNSAIGPVILGVLGSFYYFKTGHQAVLSSIQWESAFIPLSTVKYPWSPAFVILNTLGPQILTAVAVPLTVLWKRPLQTSEQHSSSDEPSSSQSPSARDKNPAVNLLSDVVQAACTYILYVATINLATTIWAGHLRRHLMLYRIFCPRFMLAAAVLGVVDVILILVSVVAVRWNTLSVADIFGW